MHERWETLGPETLDSIRDAEGVPHEAVSAPVSLDGVMVPLRAGEDGRAEASWREAACGTVSFHDARGERLKTLYLGRMPESGKVTLKAQLASEVAHIRQLRPDVRIVRRESTPLTSSSPSNTPCQRRSKISPPGRSKTSPLNVMRYAVLGGCPGSPDRRDPRCFV